MMRLSIYLITCCVLIFSSCTLEKRAFRKGYYISWNKSIPKEKPQPKDKASEAKTEVIIQSSVSKDTICKEDTKSTEELRVAEIPDSLQTKETVLIEEQVVRMAATTYSETALVERLAEAIKKIKEKKVSGEESSNRKLNLFALNSFVFAMGYVILIFYAFDKGSLNWPVVLAVLCFFTAIIFAIVALVKWKRNRTGFWGTFFALMALILLVAGSFLFLIYVISNSSFG